MQAMQKIEDNQEVELKSSIGELVVAANDAVVMTYADLSHATDLVKAIKQRAKDAEDARTRITKPINDGLREINSRFKAMLAPLQTAEDVLKNKMLTFTRAQEEKARQEAAQKEKERQAQLEKERQESEARRAQEAEQAADPTLDRPALPPIEREPLPPVVQQPIQPEIRKTTYGQSGAVFTAKKVWDFELTDLSQVPVEFVKLDDVKIRNAVRAGIRDIPGIRIYEKDVAQVK